VPSPVASLRTGPAGVDAVRPVLPDVSIRQLEYLVAVAESPTWAIAAERVGVSPSALSQGLAELERRIGVELFDRVGRRRVLRDGAEPVLRHARRVLGLTTDLADWAARVRSGTSGRIRLGMIDAAATVHHAHVLHAFRRERGDIDLRLTVAPSSELLDQVVAGRLDLAVIVEPPLPAPGIGTLPLLDEELAVYGPTDRPDGGPSTWGPWVLFPEGSHTRDLIAEALVRLGADVEVVAESHQPDVLAEMVRLGLGWTVLPSAQAEHGDRPLRRRTTLTSRRLVVASRSGSVSAPALDDLVDRLRDDAGDGAHRA
jgi:DNA-binding transcriptional LysR family regulator